MATDDKTILKIKDIAKSTIPLGSKAILYGSRARGDARNDSDWDILILLDKDRLEQADYDNVSYPFSPVRMRPWHRNQSYSLYKKRMGIVLFYPILRECKS